MGAGHGTVGQQRVVGGQTADDKIDRADLERREQVRFSAGPPLDLGAELSCQLVDQLDLDAGRLAAGKSAHGGWLTTPTRRVVASTRARVPAGSRGSPQPTRTSSTSSTPYRIASPSKQASSGLPTSVHHTPRRSFLCATASAT